MRAHTRAGWQSGYAAACKAVYAGSIPTPASTIGLIFSADQVHAIAINSSTMRHAAPDGEIGRSKR